MMRLIACRNSHIKVRLLCIKCDKWFNSDDLYADVEGEPFKDYYCIKCVPTDILIPEED